MYLHSCNYINTSSTGCYKFYKKYTILIFIKAVEIIVEICFTRNMYNTVRYEIARLKAKHTLKP